ncbi:MAG: hypothetical protein WC746_02585 [archaeon]|jgi:hypothetical protein
MVDNKSSKALLRRQRNKALVGLGLVSALVSGLFGYVLPKQREETKRFKQEQLEWAKKEADFEKKRVQDDLEYEAQLKASRESGEALRAKIESGEIIPRVYINSRTGEQLDIEYIKNDTNMFPSGKNSFQKESKSKQRVGAGVGFNRSFRSTLKPVPSMPQALALISGLKRARARRAQGNKLRTKGIARRR